MQDYIKISHHLSFKSDSDEFKFLGKGSQLGMRGPEVRKISDYFRFH